MNIASPQCPPTDAGTQLPYKLKLDGDDLKCGWLTLDDGRFTEPFFDETIRRLKSLPDNRKRRSTGLNDITEAAKGLDPAKPFAFVFHISRCGSTIVSQALASSDRFIALAEVPFFDEILRLPIQYPALAEKYDTNALYKAALQLYGQKRHVFEEHVLIKTDCWHIFFYETLRRMFPETPFILLYRNPAEVLQSLLKKPGIHIIPDIVEPQLYGFPGPPETYNMMHYASAVIEKMLEKFMAVSQADSNAILVNYSEGAAGAVDRIAASAGIVFNETERPRISERLRYHSKFPRELFTGEQPAEEPECIKPAAAVYRQLEALRIARAEKHKKVCSPAEQL